MSLILIKTADCEIPSEAVLRGAMQRHSSGGCYAMVENKEKVKVFEVSTNVKNDFEKIIQEVNSIRNDKFNDGIMVFLFVNSYCAAKEGEVESNYVFSSEDDKDNILYILGAGNFKWLKGSGNIGEKNFINFCHWTFDEHYFGNGNFSGEAVNKVLSNVINVQNSDDKFLIIESRDGENLKFLHNCDYDNDIGLFASNDNYGPSLDYEEKSYLACVLSAKIHKQEKGIRTPHVIKTQILAWTDKKIKSEAKKLNIPAFK